MAELGQYLQYLQAKYRSETVKAYVYDVQNYVNFVGSDKAQGATYADILAYLGHLKQRNAQKDGKTDPLQRPLSALKTYYDFLIATDARQSHPLRERGGAGTGRAGVYRIAALVEDPARALDCRHAGLSFSRGWMPDEDSNLD